MNLGGGVQHGEGLYLMHCVTSNAAAYRRPAAARQNRGPWRRRRRWHVVPGCCASQPLARVDAKPAAAPDTPELRRLGPAPDVERRVARELCKVCQLVVVDAAHDDHVDLGGRVVWEGGGRVGGRANVCTSACVCACTCGCVHSTPSVPRAYPITSSRHSGPERYKRPSTHLDGVKAQPQRLLDAGQHLAVALPPREPLEALGPQRVEADVERSQARGLELRAISAVGTVWIVS